MRLFATEIWTRIWRKLNIDYRQETISQEAFQQMDVDGDGKLSRQDIKQAIERIAGLETFAGQDIVVDQMFEEMTNFQRQESDHIHLTTLQEAGKHWSTSSMSEIGSGADESSDDEV